MGEISEMMLDGTLCQGCGVYLHGTSHGVPRSCADCRRTAGQPHPVERVPCKTCGRRVKFVGLKDHMRDAHGAA